MDCLPRWLPRRPAGRAAPWRAAATAAVMAVLAVLLAALFRFDAAAVAVAVAGSLPVLYLAWAALRGPRRSRLMATR